MLFISAGILFIRHTLDIPVYFGGTLFEAYMLRDQLDHYINLMNRIDKWGCLALSFK